MTDRFANGDTANDEGGLTGDRLATGFDPTDKGFYNGGDLAGLRDELDYIDGLGTTAIWLTPSFKNRPVQGEGANVSAGYHGYWITDFTQIDPHLGTNAELEALIAEAHAKDIKVYFDIITNHTADVIDYEEGQYSYIDQETAPYLDADGHRIRPGRLRRRRRARLPRPRRGDELPLHADGDARRRRPQGAGLAQRPDAVPQPRRLDVGGRVGHVRRLRRPRRPDDRAPHRRERLRRRLPALDRPRHRRLPHRHRQARELRVLGAVVDRRCSTTRTTREQARLLHVRRGLRRRPGEALALRAQHRHELGARLHLPVAGRELRRGQLGEEPAVAVRGRRLLHDARLVGDGPADLPRQPRHGPRRLLPAVDRMPRCSATSSPTSCSSSRAASPSSTTATSRASPARAATRTPARRSSRARSPSTRTSRSSPARPRAASTASTRTRRCMRTSPSSRRCAPPTRHSPRAPRSSATSTTARACTRSRASTAPSRSSTSWRRTTRAPRRPSTCPTLTEGGVVRRALPLRRLRRPGVTADADGVASVTVPALGAVVLKADRTVSAPDAASAISVVDARRGRRRHRRDPGRRRRRRRHLAGDELRLARRRRRRMAGARHRRRHEPPRLPRHRRPRERHARRVPRGVDGCRGPPRPPPAPTPRSATP